MRKINLTIGAILLTAAMSAIAMGGDYADFKFIGFSSDGRYMAFEESGEYDGSGGEYAKTYFVDVKKNAYAIKPSVYDWDMDSMKESAKRGMLLRYHRSVAAGLAKLWIVKGNTGRQIVARLLTDWTNVQPVEGESYWIKNGDPITKKVPTYPGAFLSRGPEAEKVIFNPWLYVNNFNNDSYYELTLNKFAGTGPACQNDDALKFELTLKDNSHHADTDLQVLQKDNEIPKTRNCPYGYRIEQVYFYKDNIAVFINTFSQGFEGPDMRYTAVAAKLAYKSSPPG